MQAAQPVDLTAELAEVLRWREMEWSRIPPLSRKLVMPYLGAGDTINLDTAVTNKEDRKHLVKAYVGLRSAGLDGYTHYRVGDDDGVCLGVRWAQKRSIDLRNFRLEYRDAKEDQDEVLYYLVRDQRKELATYFATGCDATHFWDFILIMASDNGYLEIVQTLLGRGADVNVSYSSGSGSDSDSDSDDGNGYCALYGASENGHIEVVRALLSAGANARKSTKQGRTPLHNASENGHVEVVRALLEAGAGADVRRVNEYGNTPISRACNGKHIEVFRALVEAGENVDTSDSNGDTALHNATECGFTEGVRYLVERGADVDKSDTGEYGYTPVTLASLYGHEEVIRALLEAGADVNKSDTGEGIILHSHWPLIGAR